MLSYSNLVDYSNGQLVTNSLLVTEKFQKQHAHVLRSVKELMLANPKLDTLFVSTIPTTRGILMSNFVLNVQLINKQNGSNEL
jgi:phage regulator Rha-like protein